MLRKIAYSIVITLILLTPFMYSDELYNGVISAKQIWFYGAMALLMLVTALDFLFSRKPFTLKFNKIDLALLAFYIYYTIRAATTPYMPLLHNQRWINWSLCVILYLIIKRIVVINNEQLTINNEGKTISNSITKPPILNYSFLIIHLLILSALVQSIWGLLQLYDFLPSFNGNFKITGTFFNPAPYAMYLSVIFPMALGRLLYKERINNEQLTIKKIQKPEGGILTHITFPFQFLILNYSLLIKKYSSLLIYYLSFATVIAILLVLPATMIRAAWLAAAVGALVVSWPWLKQHTRLGSWLLVLASNLKYKIVAVAVTVAVIGAIGAGLFYLKKDSASGKLFTWEVTLGKIAEKPLFGYGVGRFEADYNNWQAEYFLKHPKEMNGPKGKVAGNTKYCFNEFLEMASEAGLVGILLFGSLLVLALKGGVKLRMKNERQSDYPIPSFLILLFSSFPFYNLPWLLVFFVVLAGVSSGKQAIAIPHRLSFIPQYSFATILLLLGGWFAFTLYKSNKVYKTWENANFLYDTSNYEVSIAEFKKANTLFKYNNEFLQQYGKCLSMNKDYPQANIILNEASKFGGDYMLYANLGDVYKELKQYPQAEVAYNRSAYMVPHKLYPHYLLAKLYAQIGDTLKAKVKAEEVLAMNAKVNNMAEDEIKQEMKSIIVKESHQ